jgi:hypothetical protein
MKSIGMTSIFFVFVSLFVFSCGDKSNPTAPAGPVVNKNAVTLLDGFWKGLDTGATTDYLMYTFTGNQIVMQSDSVTQDSGVFTLDFSAKPDPNDTTVHTINIQIIKDVKNPQNNGKTIQSIFSYTTPGSFTYFTYVLNNPGANRPTTMADQPGLVRLRLQNFTQ